MQSLLNYEKLHDFALIEQTNTDKTDKLTTNLCYQKTYSPGWTYLSFYKDSLESSSVNRNRKKDNVKN